MDNRQIESLVRHACEAQRFAQWVNEPLDEPASSLSQHSVARPVFSRVARAGGLAAAAVLVIGATFFALRAPAPASRPVSEPIAVAPNDSAPLTSDPASVVRTASHSEAFSPEGDISLLAYLDPGAVEGLPSLSADRSVLLAVYKDAPEGCDCVNWRFADDSRIDQANLALLSQAMTSPCRTKASEVTIFQVSGPRYMLPFHDEEARSLAACLVDSPEVCLVASPERALEAVAGNPSLSLDELCATALAYCIPNGLSVTATTLEIARR
jgi:hypothetical protein